MNLLKKNMGHFKTFLLGVGAAFAVYYLTRKDNEGKSILDDILENPDELIDKAKEYAMETVERTVHQLTK
jgi:hypothetical protein